MRRLLAFLLIFTLIICVSAPFSYAADITRNDVSVESAYATREETIRLFVEAIDKSGFSRPAADLSMFIDEPEISQRCRGAVALAVGNELVYGYDDSTIRPKAPITRAEACVLLSRALSETEFVPKYDVKFSDVPDWARFDIDRLASAGLVQGYGDGTFGTDDYITVRQVNILVERISQQPLARDDYYSYINEEWMNYTEIPEGYPMWSDTMQLSSDIVTRINSIVYDMVARQSFGFETYEKGSNKQKIVDLFTMTYDTDYRNEIGIEPIRGIIEGIDAVKNVKELTPVMARLNECGVKTLLPMSVQIDYMNSQAYVVGLNESFTGLPTSLVQSGDFKAAADEFEKYAEKLLKESGEREEDAARHAAEVTELCIDLADAAPSQADKNDVEMNYNPYTKSQFSRLLTNVNTNEYLKTMGYANASKIIVGEEKLAKKINSYYTNKNLELLKSYLKVALMDSIAFYSTTELYGAYQEYNGFLDGTGSYVDASRYAISIIQSMLGMELGELYVDKCFDDQIKTEVEAMAKTIIDTYEKRIQNLDWMSEKTKKIAIEKLKAINVQVGYPDYLKGYVNDDFKVASAKDGGSLLKSYIEYNKMSARSGANLIKTSAEVDNNLWYMLPQTVNAYYSLNTNSIVLPAGILQSPYYSSSATYEENLGGIGRIIAHEITHAFDNMGSQFDKNGNLNDWWTAEDYAAFDKLCNDFIKAYDELEPIEGYHVDGKLTLGENIADMGAMACILDIIGDNPAAQKRMFESYAVCWRSKMTDDYAKMQIATDEHAPDKVRTNMVLSNFEQFLNLYDVIEGDGMYRPVDKRLSIW